MLTSQAAVTVAAVLSLSLTRAGTRADFIEPATNTRFVANPRLDAQDYQCLGVGVRQKFIFDVYAIAFCVDADAVHSALADVQAWSEATHQHDADDLADHPAFFDNLAKGPHAKLVDLRMVRNVSAGSLAAAFKESLRDVLTPPQLDKIIAAIPGDVAKGTDVRIYTEADHASLVISVGDTAHTIDDPEVARAIWRVWLGPSSVVPTLKKSIARTVVEDLQRHQAHPNH